MLLLVLVLSFGYSHAIMHSFENHCQLIFHEKKKRISDTLHIGLSQDAHVQWPSKARNKTADRSHLLVQILSDHSRRHTQVPLCLEEQQRKKRKNDGAIVTATSQ